MIGSLLQADFEEIIAAKDWNTLRETLIELPPPDVAELIQELPPEDQGVIFRILPRELAAMVFEYIPIENQRLLVQSLSNQQVHTILNEMTPDDRTRLLEELPAEVTRKLLDELTPEELRTARQLLGYPEATVGRYMTPEYVALPPDITAREALERIRKTGRGKETLAIIYIINEKGKLLEDLRLGSLVLANPEDMIGDIEDRPAVSIPATMNVEDAVLEFERYDRVALPVVNNDGVMLGIITADDVLEFAERRATREMQKLGGTEALEEPYITVPLFTMFRKRGVWLSILFVGQLLTATVMERFNKQLETAFVLTLFVPLIISSGGNSGSQATSLIIRALALREVTLRDWWKVLRREMICATDARSAARRVGTAAPARLACDGVARLHATRAGRIHGFTRAGWGRVMGFARRQHAAIPVAASGIGSSDILRAICRNMRGRNGLDHLLRRRVHRAERNAVMSDMHFNRSSLQSTLAK